MMAAAEIVRAGLHESADLHRSVAVDRAEIVVRAAEVMLEALAGGRHVLVFGNGGSAADAQHFAAELVGRFERERRPVGVIALTTDTAILTAIGNDYGFDAVFARQVDALGRMGDVALGISTSGASKNVNIALERAKAKGLVTIGLTGRDGGETGRIAHVHVNVPGRTSARTQEVHRTLLHLMCELIEPGL
jgi:D-sedoheptulose 7-phosphate isomerase